MTYAGLNGRIFGLVLAASMLVLSFQAIAQTPVLNENLPVKLPGGSLGKDNFARFAQELMAGISAQALNPHARNGSQSAKDYNQKKYAFVGGRKMRVAIWPFHKDKIPLAKSVADGFNDKLLTALLKTQPGAITVVARDALKAIIADLSETGALESDDDPIAALMTKARNVDALIQGRLRLVEGGVSLAYKAVRMDGTILAQTARLVLPLKRSDKTALNDLLTIDQAGRQAARYFADQLSAIAEIRVGGLQYQETGLQPPFAVFFKDNVVTALQKSYANMLTGRPLKIKPSRLMGEPKAATSLKENKFSRDPESYLLTGRYWVLNQAVEIRLTLKNPENYALSWSGRLPLQNVKGLRLRPLGDFEHLRENDGLGPFKFQLTSTKGQDPIYTIGEDMTLMLRVGENAWTYCFYHQANGKVVQIFPNPHFWREFKSPLLAGGRVHSIPGKKLFPFDFKVTPPIGRELVKCFGASRDVTPDLPPELRGKSLAPLGQDRVNKLSKLFRSLPYVAISEASLVVTVTK